MRAAASLHRYDTDWHRSGEGGNALRPEPPPFDHRTSLIQPHEAAAVLAQVNPQNRDLHDVLLSPGCPGELTLPRKSIREGGDLRGLLRMSMPTSFGIRDVIPRLASFAERHPDLHIDLQFGDRRQDLVRDAVDVAIRLGRLPDSTATAKLIATIPRVVVTSPDYLARHGAPESPDDLVRHRIVGGTASAVPTAWRFHGNGQEIAIKLEPHFSTDENEGAIAAAVAGFGVTSTSGWACRRELENGALIRLLPEWSLAGIPVHTYFPMGRATRAAARGAIDHLVSAFERTPPSCRNERLRKQEMATLLADVPTDVSYT